MESLLLLLLEKSLFITDCNGKKKVFIKESKFSLLALIKKEATNIYISKLTFKKRWERRCERRWERRFLRCAEAAPAGGLLLGIINTFTRCAGNFPTLPLHEPFHHISLSLQKKKTLILCYCAMQLIANNRYDWVYHLDMISIWSPLEKPSKCLSLTE